MNTSILVKQIGTCAALLGAVVSYTAHAGYHDYVDTVYSCENDVGIYMQSAGWVVAQDSVLGTKRVDRIMAIALSLVATGKQTGYFDTEGKTPIQWCGVQAIPITVLGIDGL